MEALKALDGGDAEYNAAIDQALGVTWNLSIKARNETFNDQQRIRYNVMKAVK
jgi:replication factor A1